MQCAGPLSGPAQIVPDAATGVVVTDSLPANVTLVSTFPDLANPSQGEFNAATGVWTVGSLPAAMNPMALSLNENPFPPLVDGSLAANVNRYPEPQPAELRRVMAALYGVAPENLVVTRGADDAIDILIRTFCRPGQ